jgi:probable rRNA maturation factor
MAGSSLCAINVELNLQEVSGDETKSSVEVSPISLADWQRWLEVWLTSLDGDLPKSDTYELTLRLTDDSEIQALNSQYRQQNKPTDVLAFAALEAEMPIFQPEEPEPLYLGDIIISVETAARQAQQNNHSLTIELAWLASHGLLHLLGWDHPDDARLEEMLAQQANLLKQVGLSTFF